MNNIEILQKLLIEEIIQKEYSQEEFEQYVQVQAPDKEDLSQWNYDDLKKCIVQFQSLKKNQKQTLIQDNEIQGFQNIDEKLYSVIVTNQHKIYIDNITLDPYEKVIKCQLEKYLFENDVELQFQISQKQEIQVYGLLLLLKMLLSFKFKHFRCNGRFQEHYRNLQNGEILYVNTFLKKLFQGSPMEDQQNQKKSFQKIEEIILSIKNLLSIYNKIPIIRTIQPCLWFINEVNDQLLQKKLKDELYREKRYNLQQKQTKTGEINVSLTFDGYKKFLEQSSYPKNAINILNQVIFNMNEFLTCQKKSQEYLGNAASCLFELTNTLPKYPEQSSLIEYINLINDHFNQIIYEIEDSCALLDNHLKLTFVKILGSHQSYIRLCQNVYEIRNKFVQDYNILNKKKEDHIKNNDIKIVAQKVIQQNKFDQSELDKLLADTEYLKSFLYIQEAQQNQQLQDQLVLWMNNLRLTCLRLQRTLEDFYMQNKSSAKNILSNGKNQLTNMKQLKANKIEYIYYQIQIEKLSLFNQYFQNATKYLRFIKSASIRNNRKNYDQEKFENLANERYPDKDDLSCWTLDELQKLINEFQDQQNNIIMNQGLENQNQQQRNQQIQNEAIQNDSQQSVQIIQKKSRLVPRKKSYQIFNNTITKEEAQKKGFNEEQIQILSQILEERSQINLDNQIIFQEYQKQIKCNLIQYYIEKDIELNFKITQIEKTRKPTVFSIETLPYNWKVERTKEDFKTLEKMLQIYLPEYTGYIIQYNGQQKIEKHFENALRIYYNKPKTRSLIYFLLFLNDNSSQKFHVKPFSYYSQNENNIKKFNLNQIPTQSGLLNIEFNQQNYQNYKNLQAFQTSLSKGCLDLEKQFQQSLHIINQETLKMKLQLQDFQKSTKNEFIQNFQSQNMPESSLKIFFNNMTVALQISDQIQQFFSNSIFSIQDKILETVKILEQPLIKCQGISENIKNIYFNEFTPTKKKFLKQIDIQNFLNQYGIQQNSISYYQYEILSSIIRDIFPLQVDLSFEYLQQEKDQYAYLIFQILQEGQTCYQKLFKDINFICTKNFEVLAGEISKICKN